MGVSWSDDEALNDDEYSSDDVKEEEDEDDDNDNVKGLTTRGKNPVSTILPN
jgi:phosphate-selective porin